MMVDWHKYPQNKPERDGWYLTTISSGMGTCVFRSHYSKERVYDWQDAHGIIPNENVLAFAELPKPYSPTEGSLTMRYRMIGGEYHNQGGTIPSVESEEK
jgi:hypothetical protein